MDCFIKNLSHNNLLQECQWNAIVHLNTVWSFSWSSGFSAQSKAFQASYGFLVSCLKRLWIKLSKMTLESILVNSIAKISRFQLQFSVMLITTFPIESFIHSNCCKTTPLYAAKRESHFTYSILDNHAS